eukprot:6496386-Pyramimonas_sp.AAC.1
MVCLIAPVTNDSDVQDSQKQGSVRLKRGTRDLSILRPWGGWTLKGGFRFHRVLLRVPWVLASAKNVRKRCNGSVGIGFGIRPPPPCRRCPWTGGR